MAGDGPILHKIRARAKQLGLEGVSFPGYISGDQKRQAFASAGIYCLPTHFEGMPNSILEAMAHGLPIITRNVGGLKDFFEQGRMGFITDSLDAVVIAGLIERLIRDADLRARIGAYNRSYAWYRFRPSAVAQRLMSIYNEVNGMKLPAEG